VLLSPAALCARGPALDIMEHQDQVESECPEQVSFCVGLLPVAESTFIQTSVNIADRLWAFIRLVKHKSIIVKELRGWRSQQQTVVVFAAIRFRYELVFARGGRRRWVWRPFVAKGTCRGISQEFSWAGLVESSLQDSL
jgi:hypothetical protein